MTSYRVINIIDRSISFELEFIEENGFINATKLCNNYKKNFNKWKEEHYYPLCTHFSQFCIDHKLENCHTLNYNQDIFIDPSLAFHLAYWIDYKIGIYFCANMFKIINATIRQ